MLVGCGWNIEYNCVVVMTQPLNWALWPVRYSAGLAQASKGLNIYAISLWPHRLQDSEVKRIMSRR